MTTSPWSAGTVGRWERLFAVGMTHYTLIYQRALNAGSMMYTIGVGAHLVVVNLKPVS